MTFEDVLNHCKVNINFIGTIYIELSVYPKSNKVQRIQRFTESRLDFHDVFNRAINLNIPFMIDLYNNANNSFIYKQRGKLYVLYDENNQPYLWETNQSYLYFNNLDEYNNNLIKQYKLMEQI